MPRQTTRAHWATAPTIFMKTAKTPLPNDANAWQLTVSGFDGAKKYRNKAFVSTYNAAKGHYSIPKGYPLADKEF